MGGDRFLARQWPTSGPPAAPPWPPAPYPHKIMPLDRVLEPEVMDSPEDARDYDAMDHREVNARFVDDLLDALTTDLRSLPTSTGSIAPIEVDEDESPRLDILDLGTGTAQIPVELCRQLDRCRVMAIDAAVEMLQVARLNVELASLRDRIQLEQIDAKRLPFRNAMFDVVMSNSIVHHIPQPELVLAEAVRVVRPRGLLLIRDLVRPESEQQLQAIVDRYASGCNDHQRSLFAASLRAALSLAEVQALVMQLGFPPATVALSSDRHWTWRATQP